MSAESGIGRLKDPCPSKPRKAASDYNLLGDDRFERRERRSRSVYPPVLAGRGVIEVEIDPTRHV